MSVMKVKQIIRLNLCYGWAGSLWWKLRKDCQEKLVIIELKNRSLKQIRKNSKNTLKYIPKIKIFKELTTKRLNIPKRISGQNYDFLRENWRFLASCLIQILLYFQIPMIFILAGWKNLAGANMSIRFQVKIVVCWRLFFN